LRCGQAGRRCPSSVLSHPTHGGGNCNRFRHRPVTPVSRSRIEPANDFLDALLSTLKNLLRGETDETHSADSDAARAVDHRRVQRRAHQ
ncbi:hypothetical protein, partial [Burkholderia sp. AU29985]|uniref:hypothetical protein n=1 Tax=Burkholderia sp. AU29985 TaxID=2153378 RepID=UPI001C625F52